MKFLGQAFKKSWPDFRNIEGYDAIKDIIIRALETDDNYNILLVGPPASSKTLFLMGILGAYPKAKYFDASNTTNKILDILEERRPPIALLDELDKLPIRYHNQLLGLIESGEVKVVQQKKSYEFEIEGCKIFATANSLDKLLHGSYCG